MKVFLLLVLILHALIASALVKRMDDEALRAVINKYIKDFGNQPVHWNVYHMGGTAMQQVIGMDGRPEFNPDGSPKMFDAGHHWVVAEPLDVNGHYNGKNYIKSHLSFTQSGTSTYMGTINTKIISSGSSKTESAAKVLNKDYTSKPVTPQDMMVKLGYITNESFKDGKFYYMYNKCTNCQGFSADLFDKVYDNFLKKTEDMEICR